MKVIDIIIKDVKIIFSDKKALIILILMPLVLSTILGSALKSSFKDNFNTKKINIAIVKKYNSKDQLNKIENNELVKNMVNNSNIDIYLDNINIDKIFMDNFLKSEEINKIISYIVTDEKNALKLLKEKKVSSIVILPDNFIFNTFMNFFLLGASNETEIEVIGIQDRKITNKIVQEIIKSFSENINSLIIRKNVFIESLLENKIDFRNENLFDILNNKIYNNNSSVIINFKNIDGKGSVNSKLYYSIGMTTMFILYIAGYGSKLLLDEKLDKTYHRLVISGLRKYKLIIGKFFVMFVIGIIQVFIMISYSSTVLDVYWGNFINTAIVTLLSVFTVSALGIMLASISYKAENYKVADITQSIIFQIMALLGGSFIPIDLLPDFVKKLSNSTLNGLSLKAYNKIALGYRLSEITPFLVALILQSIVFITIALFILNYEGRRKIFVKHN